MNEEEVENWLTATVSDAFMNIFFYDRKGDEEMSLNQLKCLIDCKIITKELLLKVFTKQIEKEFKTESKSFEELSEQYYNEF